MQLSREGWLRRLRTDDQTFDCALQYVRHEHRPSGIYLSAKAFRSMRYRCGLLRRGERVIDDQGRAVAPAPVAGSLSASGNGSAVSIAAKNG